jgi:alkylation response protein AidB-like acyl-CoA dehydrogenase
VIEFQLTEEHEALQKTVREFCAGEVAPYIKEWDEKSHFERSVFDKMAELGLLGVCIPEQYGGAGFRLHLARHRLRGTRGRATRFCASRCRCTSGSTA